MARTGRLRAGRWSGSLVHVMRDVISSPGHTWLPTGPARRLVELAVGHIWRLGPTR